MIIYKKQQEEINVIADIVCDICNLSCLDKSTGIVEKAEFSVDWGYGSRKDGECWHVDFCEACADRFSVWVASQGGKIRKTCCG